ncbi:MAG: DNA repair ATPase [Aureliella sp.]
MTEQLATGTYEVLRNRLRDAAKDLRGRFELLNAARAEVFGNIETKLGSTAHVSTDHNCVPRDLHAIGDLVLLGYNVQFGLKTDISLEDVFSLYRLDGEVAHPLPLDQIFNDRFRRDFSELYRYYKNTTFLRFFVTGPNLYFVFQVGKTSQDIKAFKWVLQGDTLQYLDNRSDHEVRLPPQHAFRWNRANRDQHRSGLHPHISIDDIVFVECVGGDLTIKVEDNTEDGSGIYAEPVENPDQTLDDAEIFYCILGNLVLLKMRPYQEKEYRHLVFSVKQQTAMRLDGIERSCVLLPDDQGIIFPTGFVLQTGENKLFDHGFEDLHFDRMIAAQNGEDFLYLFTDLESGTYLHLRYNLIKQEVDTPLICHGQALFDDGQMITFRGQESAAKHHALQLWQTPYVGPNFQSAVETDSMLYKIGNRELVRGMAECQEVLHLVDRDDSYEALYVDLVKRTTDILDSYFWLDREDTYQLSAPIGQIREAASAAVEEFDKVVRVKRETKQALETSQKDAKELIDAIGRSAFHRIEEFVDKLAELRKQRGHAIGLRERHYIDEKAVDELEETLTEAADRLGHRCVQFLLDDKSLLPFGERIAEIESTVSDIDSVMKGKEVEAELTNVGEGLELLIETVSQLKIEDLTQRTLIVDRTGNLLADLNRVRSGVKSHLRELLSGEMEAEYASQTKLLDQSASGALETADSPERVDEALTSVMLQLEELEGRYAEFDELIGRLTEKRESLYEAFEAKRQQLVEARSKRAESLASAATRILQGINSRATRLKEPDELRSYFASDPMVAKVRSIAEQLGALGDTVRQDDVLSRLKSTSDDALRQLRDRLDLYTGGEGQIKLGKHHFSVNRQAVELTSVVRNGELQLHLTGTQFFQPFSAPELEAARDLWQQALPSESDEVYRGEYLAAELFANWDPNQKSEFAKAEPESKLEIVRTEMQSRHDEGYSRGVHDSDAVKILNILLQMSSRLGLLRYSPSIRGTARMIWMAMVSNGTREAITQWVQGYAEVQRVLPAANASPAYVKRIRTVLGQNSKRLLQGTELDRAAQFLFDHLCHGNVFVLSHEASVILAHLDEHLPADDRKRLHETLNIESIPSRPAWILALDAVDGYLADSGMAEQWSMYRKEVAAELLLRDQGHEVGADVPTRETLEGIVGDHGLVKSGKLQFDYHQFLDRLIQYRMETVPRFESLRETKHRLLIEADKEIRTEEFKPKVLTSFVRNQLIDEVYLPLVGDNLAKQIGSAGENARSDRMGLLLLISPPGYGKTTLMEYIANRLGLVFVKVNGPALGHGVTSLDPSEATNASAREEVKRINMALEMGDNVMLYLDDIQHCNPELLQKFIPLCDATRRIEGVWQGEPKTYDLRGRKVAVVMAGNPYTESGDRFQIPDMLSNRADVYNLGEIIGDSAAAFELSYIENCLTSNPILQDLSRASSKDQRAIIHAASTGSIETLDLEANISPDQLSDMISVLEKLMRVRDVILQVNRAYIQSAAQADAYRTEPPFKLQGSYRNMNRIAERVVPVMNDNELESLVFANYEQDAQTLTRDGESNLLKFKELAGVLTPDEEKRWESIKYAFVESVRMQGIDGEDSAAQVLRSLAGLRDGLESIRRTIADGLDNPSNDDTRSLDALQKIDSTLSKIGSSLQESIKRGSEELRAANASLPEQKVLVQHSVPRIMTDLIESQFQLLYDGLRPVLENAAGTKQQLTKLKESVEACLQDYKDLQAEINSSTSNSNGQNED